MLRNYWYTACASLLLTSEPRATRVLDQDLALFRDRDGRPHALLNRCSHRGAPLSMGDVVDDALTCRYHGWRFDGSGACVHIPSLAEHRQIPPRCATPSFPCAEQDGYVWVWMGDEGVTPAPCPVVQGVSDHAWLQGSWEWSCASTLGVENNMDWCHPAFAHRDSTHPQAERVRATGLADMAYEVRMDATSVVVFSPPAAGPGDPVPGTSGVVMRFDLPDRVTIHRPATDVRLITHYVPTGPNTCRVERLIRQRTPAAPGIIWMEDEDSVLSEDRQLLEAAQVWYDRAGDRSFENSVDADVATLMVRRLLKLAHDGDRDAPANLQERRRVVSVRA